MYIPYEADQLKEESPKAMDKSTTSWLVSEPLFLVARSHPKISTLARKSAGAEKCHQTMPTINEASIADSQNTADTTTPIKSCVQPSETLSVKVFDLNILQVWQ